MVTTKLHGSPKGKLRRGRLVGQTTASAAIGLRAATGTHHLLPSLPILNSPCPLPTLLFTQWHDPSPHSWVGAGGGLSHPW